MGVSGGAAALYPRRVGRRAICGLRDRGIDQYVQRIHNSDHHSESGVDRGGDVLSAKHVQTMLQRLKFQAVQQENFWIAMVAARGTLQAV